MPQSLVKILVHAVFSTKNRSDLVVPEIEDGLFGYMHGIVENNKSKLILANGTANHVYGYQRVDRRHKAGQLGLDK